MPVPQERIDRGLYWGRAWSLVGGCTPESPGCLHCWSARETHMRAGQSNVKMQARYGGLTDAEGRWTGEIRLMEQDLTKPLTVKEPTTWAIWNDLFHPDVPPDFIRRAWMVMAQCQHHTFLILTKRPKRMKEWITEHCGKWCLFERPLINVYVGTTVENRDYLWRINELLQTPARLRYVSLEPLLELLDMQNYLGIWTENRYWETVLGRPIGPRKWTATAKPDDAVLHKRQLDLIILGGEAGSHARRCDSGWIRKVVQQCDAAAVPVFVKQLGTVWAKYHGAGRRGHDMWFWARDLRVRQLPGGW